MNLLRVLRTRQASFCVAAVLSTLLVGCSSGAGTPDDDGYTGADWASEMPQCAELWVDGNTVPEEYSGCVDEAGLHPATPVQCTEGDGDLLTYEGFFARQGGQVAAGSQESAAYAQALQECSPAGS